MTPPHAVTPIITASPSALVQEVSSKDSQDTQDFYKEDDEVSEKVCNFLCKTLKPLKVIPLPQKDMP